MRSDFAAFSVPSGAAGAGAEPCGAAGAAEGAPRARRRPQLGTLRIGDMVQPSDGVTRTHVIDSRADVRAQPP